MPTPIDEYDTRLETARDHIDQQLTQATDAFNTAFDRQVLFQLAAQAAEIGHRLPEATTISLTDWSDEVNEGEPFDVDLFEVFDTDGNLLDDVGGANGALTIRHHWTIDQLRVDPEAGGDDMYHPANRISIAKATAWLERQFDQQPTTTGKTADQLVPGDILVTAAGDSLTITGEVRRSSTNPGYHVCEVDLGVLLVDSDEKSLQVRTDSR